VGSRSAGAALLLGLAFAGVATAQPGALSPAYAAAVERYASGERDAAVAAAAAMSQRELRESVEALRTLGKRARACAACADSVAWRQALVPAALMLHTDASILRRPDEEPVRLHESLALELVHALTDDPEWRGFARRWYRVMAELALGDTRWSDALTWAARGLDAFPRTAELLLVKGAIEEGLSGELASPSPGDVFDPSTRQTQLDLDRGREARQRLERARRLLRDAIAVDPSLPEARLRLGRVAWRLGDADESRAAFEAVLAQTRSRDTAFLAYLFRGRLDEDAGHLEDAVRSYESALALDARSQSARLALSHVRLRLGDPAAARREVDAALAPAPRLVNLDLFWVYPWGPAVGVEERLAALRQEASL
jgi:tetratricopeptide (TPR) repeat protein